MWKRYQTRSICLTVKLRATGNWIKKPTTIFSTEMFDFRYVLLNLRK